MPRVTTAGLASIIVLLAGCATGGDSKGTGHRLNLETREPLEIVDEGGRVAVEVGASDTVISVGDTTIVCKNYRGYLGRVATRQGSVRMGRVGVSWNGARLQVRGPDRWTPVDIGKGHRIFIHQDGRLGRSIFRD